MGVTKSLILFKADEINFANWLRDFFESRKENLYEIPPTQNRQGAIVWITECKIIFDTENKNSHGHMRGWVNIDGAFDLFIDEMTSEESRTSSKKRVFLPYRLPLTLYEISILPTTKGILVKINGREEIDFEELITTIFSQWEGEEIHSKQTSLSNVTSRQNSESIQVDSSSNFNDRIEKALSLLQGYDDIKRNQIIIIDWWNQKKAKVTVMRLKNQGCGDLDPKSIYNIRSILHKTYPDIAPPKVKRRRNQPNFKIK